MNQGNLEYLLANMAPRLRQEQYVFVTVDQQLFIQMPKEIPVYCFKEEEGFTLILSDKHADLYHIGYERLYAWITLEVVSDLNAVGFTAAFSKLLGDAGISCNVVAAYYHDHIFVPWEDRENALELLSTVTDI